MTISITAIACRTPKLMKLRGNMSHDPTLTSSAQPATCSQRRQKRGQPWPRCRATACPNPAQKRKIATMKLRCVVQNGSV